MKKYNLSAIMKRAWEIKKEDNKNIFAICLKMAWEEAKKGVKKMVKKLIGSEKQIKWAKDIIEASKEAIERFNLVKIEEEFEAHDRADWFIENYAFTTKDRTKDTAKYSYFKWMLDEELELRTAGLKRREANRIGREVFRPMYDEITKEFLA